MKAKRRRHEPEFTKGMLEERLLTAESCVMEAQCCCYSNSRFANYLVFSWKADVKHLKAEGADKK